MSEDMKNKNTEVVNEEVIQDHDHNHDHDHDHDHDHAVTVVIENEDGTTDEYPVVDEFEYNDQVYVLVENADETVTPLRAVGEEGDLEFLSEDEFAELAVAYQQFMDEFGEDNEDDEEDNEDKED